MANYLYNGVELPDINEVWTDKETYPYAYIVPLNGSYLFAYSPVPLIVYNGENATDTIPKSSVISNVPDGFVLSIYGVIDGSWLVMDTLSPNDGDIYIQDALPIWSNSDVVNYDANTVYLAASDPVPVEEPTSTFDQQSFLMGLACGLLGKGLPKMIGEEPGGSGEVIYDTGQTAVISDSDGEYAIPIVFPTDGFATGDKFEVIYNGDVYNTELYFLGNATYATFPSTDVMGTDRPFEFGFVYGEDGTDYMAILTQEPETTFTIKIVRTQRGGDAVIEDSGTITYDGSMEGKKTVLVQASSSSSLSVEYYFVKYSDSPIQREALVGSFVDNFALLTTAVDFGTVESVYTYPEAAFVTTTVACVYSSFDVSVMNEDWSGILDPGTWFLVVTSGGSPIMFPMVFKWGEDADGISYCTYNDQTEPVLPDYDTEKYPYAYMGEFIIDSFQMQLIVSTAPYLYDATFGTDAFSYILYKVENYKWVESERADDTTDTSMPTSTGVKWCNTDYLNADGTVKLAASEPVAV